MFFLLCFFTNLYTIVAQDYPSEWNQFTSNRFLYSIASEENEKDLSETRFVEGLLNTVRTNIAKQIEIRINDCARLNKTAINGKSSVSYNATTTFSTDVNIKLLKTLHSYDVSSKKGSAIAYIEKQIARDYYEKELLTVLLKTDNTISEAEHLIAQGFKIKAKNVLEQNLYLFQTTDESLFWLNIFELPKSEYADWQSKLFVREQKIKKMITDLQHGTAIFISCNAKLNGSNYTKLANELKAELAKRNCNLTSNPTDADFVIQINCNNRNGNNPVVGGVRTFFSYIDASLTITKTATSQCIYEDEISVKGGHTLGYAEAARAAYKKVKNELSPILIENIQQ